MGGNTDRHICCSGADVLIDSLESKSNLSDPDTGIDFDATAVTVRASVYFVFNSRC